MKKVILISLFALLAWQVAPAQASTSSCVYYFYGDGCSHCKKTTPVIDMLAEKYPSLDMHKFEVWNNQTNKTMFSNLLSLYNIDRGGVPTVFIGDTYFMGDTPIIDNLEDKILSTPTTACPGFAAQQPQQVEPEPYNDSVPEEAVNDIKEANLENSVAQQPEEENNKMDNTAVANVDQDGGTSPMVIYSAIAILAATFVAFTIYTRNK